MHPPRRLSLLLAGCCLAGGLSAQNYVGNLNGSSVDSTFEQGTLGQFYSPSIYNWTVVSGNPEAFTYTNSIMTGGSGGGDNLAAYDLRYVFASTPLAANSTYTLSFDVGYAAGAQATGQATYRFDLGTWNGGTFTSLQSRQGVAVMNGSDDAGPSNSTTYFLNYTTGASPGSDSLYVEFAQIGANPGLPDYMSFDNVQLSYVAAIPEPSTYAAILGGLALLGTMIARRRRQLAA
jgi:hypothetical protein